MRYHLPDDVARTCGAHYGEDQVLYLTSLPSGKSLLLSKNARAMWTTAIVDPRCSLAGVPRLARRATFLPNGGPLTRGSWHKNHQRW